MHIFYYILIIEKKKTIYCTREIVSIKFVTSPKNNSKAVTMRR